MLDKLENDPASLGLNGHTQVIPVLGYPVKQVRSPRPLSLRMQRLGLNALQIPMLVGAENLSQVVTSLKLVGNIAGFVLTVPHKIPGLALVDRLSIRAQAAGSINAMRREADGTWTGDNFDGAGFITGLRADGHDPAGRSVMIVGLGGAGASLAASLAEAGAAALELFDIDQGRCKQVAERLGTYYPDVRVNLLQQPVTEEVDIAVNATHIGMQDDDPLPFDPTLLKPDAVVADVIMSPPDTALLKSSSASGRACVKGENVLFYQLDLLASFFAHAL